MKKRENQFVSLAMAVIMTVSQWTIAPQAWTAPSPEIKIVSPGFQLSLPPELGTIQALHSGKGPTLIHIQTAHGNYEAQKKIQAILHYLKDAYGFKFLLLEGSASKLHPELLKFFPERMDLTMSVAEELTQAALVKGDELFLLEDSQAQAYGIEDIPTYRRTREAFRTVILEQEKTQKFIQKMDLQIERLTAPYLSKQLRNFLRRLEAFESKTFPLLDWLAYLKIQAKEILSLDLSDPFNQFDWPMLLRIYKLRELEAKFDFNSFAKEREDFLKAIRRVPEETREAIRRLLFSPLSQNSLPDPETGLLFEKMFETLPENFNFDAYPNVKLFIGHLIFQSELKEEKLIEEVNRLTDKIQVRLAKTSEEKIILSLLNDHRLLKRLFALELTPEDYETITGARDRLRPSHVVQRFLKFNDEKRVRGLEFSHVEEIDSLFEKALEFYRGVKERDRFMLQNIQRCLKEIHQDKAVIITGGFHAEPFKNFFEKQNYNYALIAPKITSTQGREAYLRVVLQNPQNPVTKSTMETTRLTELPLVRKALGDNLALMKEWTNSIRRRVLKQAKEFVRAEPPSFIYRSEARQDPPGDLGLLVVPDSAAVAQEVADRLIEKVRENPKTVLGLTAGRTMEVIFTEVVRHFKSDPALDFSQVSIFNVDEFLGLDKDHPKSYRHVVEEKLIEPMERHDPKRAFQRSNIHFLDGRTGNPQKEINQYLHQIDETRGIQWQLMGIAQTGHYAFHQPAVEITGSLAQRLNTISAASNSDFRKIRDRNDFILQEDIPIDQLPSVIKNILEIRHSARSQLGQFTDLVEYLKEIREESGKNFSAQALQEELDELGQRLLQQSETTFYIPNLTPDLEGLLRDTLASHSFGLFSFKTKRDLDAPRAKVISLTIPEILLESKVRGFQNLRDVPPRVLSLTEIIQDSSEIILAAFGRQKAEAIRDTFQRKATPEYTSSVLQMHPRTLVIVDQAAASLLDLDIREKAEANRRGRMAIGEEKVLDLIKSLLPRSTYVGERIHAAQELGRLGEKAYLATPSLIEILKQDLQPELRNEVVKALAHIGKAALPGLLGALQDPNEKVRLGSVEALRQWAVGLNGVDKEQAAIAIPILQRLAEKDSVADVQRIASEALREIGVEAPPDIRAEKFPSEAAIARYNRRWNRAKNMKLRVGHDVRETGILLALEIIEGIQKWREKLGPEKPIVIQFATGETPWLGYSKLADFLNTWETPATKEILRQYGIDTAKEAKPDMKRIVALCLDSLFPQRRQDYHAFPKILDDVFDRLGISRKNRIYFYGDGGWSDEKFSELLTDIEAQGLLFDTEGQITAPVGSIQHQFLSNMEEQSRQKTREVEELGGAHIVIAGVGPSNDGEGHVAYMEKGISSDQRAFIGSIGYHTAAGHAKENGGMDKLYTKDQKVKYGFITFGWHELLLRQGHKDLTNNVKVIVIATGASKSSSVQKGIEEEQNPTYPLTGFQKSRGVFILDATAAKDLRLFQNPWEFETIAPPTGHDAGKWKEEELRRFFIRLGKELAGRRRPAKKIRDLTPEDAWANALEKYEDTDELHQITQANLDVLVNRQVWGEARDHVAKRIEENLATPEDISRRLGLKSDSRIVLISPHLDDDFLAYRDLIKAWAHQKHTISSYYLTKGFTAVHDSYMLDVLSEMQAWSDETIRELAGVVESQGTAKSEKQSELLAILVRLLEHRRAHQNQPANRYDVWNWMNTEERTLRAQLLFLSLNRYLLEKIGVVPMDTKAKLNAFINFVRETVRRKPRWGSSDIKIVQEIKTQLRVTESQTALMTFGVNLSEIYEPMSSTWYTSGLRGTAEENDIETLKKVFREKKPHLIVVNGEGFPDYGAHSTTEASTITAVRELFREWEATQDPALAFVRDLKVLQYAGVWERIPIEEANISVVVPGDEMDEFDREFRNHYPSQAPAPVPDAGLAGPNYFSEQVQHNAQTTRQEILDLVEIPARFRRYFDNVKTGVLNYKLLDLSQPEVLEKFERKVREMRRVKEALDAIKGEKLHGPVPKPDLLSMTNEVLVALRAGLPLAALLDSNEAIGALIQVTRLKKDKTGLSKEEQRIRQWGERIASEVLFPLAQAMLEVLREVDPVQMQNKIEMLITRFSNRSEMRMSEKKSIALEKLPPEQLRALLGRPVVKASFNESPVVNPNVLREVHKNASELNTYGYIEGQALKTELARALDIDPSWIWVDNGSERIIFRMFEQLVSPDDEVVLVVPTYTLIERALLRRIPQEQIRYVFLKPENNFSLSPEEVAKAISPHTKFVVLVNPNNPTGSYTDPESFEALIQAHPSVYFFFDEAYIEFVEKSALGLAKKYPNVIITRTFSKAYGMADLRVGYAISQNPTVIASLTSGTEPNTLPRISERAAIVALDDREFVKRNVKRIRAWKSIFINLLSRIPGLKIYPSHANFFLLDLTQAGIDANTFSQELQREGIFVRNLSGHTGLEGSYVRVTVMNPDDNLKIALAISQVIQRRQSSKSIREFVHLGLDVGGTNIRRAFLSPQTYERLGEVNTVATNKESQKGVVSQIADLIVEALKEARARQWVIDKIVVAFPTRFSEQKGERVIVDRRTNLPGDWYLYPLDRELVKALTERGEDLYSQGVELRAVPDDQAAAEGELLPNGTAINKNLSEKRILSLTLGTGVGSILIKSGRSYVPNPYAGWIENMIPEKQEPEGRETFLNLVSGSALGRRAREFAQLQWAWHRRLFFVKDFQDLEKITGISVLHALHHGTPMEKDASRLLLEQFGRNLGLGVISLITGKVDGLETVERNPEIVTNNYKELREIQAVIFGGGLSQGEVGEIIERKANEMLAKEGHPEIRVYRSTLQGEAGILGSGRVPLFEDSTGEIMRSEVRRVLSQDSAVRNFLTPQVKNILSFRFYIFPLVWLSQYGRDLLSSVLTLVLGDRVAQAAGESEKEKFARAKALFGLSPKVSHDYILGPEFAFDDGGLAFARTVFGDHDVVVIVRNPKEEAFVKEYNRKFGGKILIAHHVAEAKAMLRNPWGIVKSTEPFAVSFKQTLRGHLTIVTTDLFNRFTEISGLDSLVSQLRSQFQFVKSA